MMLNEINRNKNIVNFQYQSGYDVISYNMTTKIPYRTQSFYYVATI